MAALLGALPPAGWACSEGGTIANGAPQWDNDDDDDDDDDDDEYEQEPATFKHTQPLEEGDVWSMQVEVGCALVGFAGEKYDVEKSWMKDSSTAWVSLNTPYSTSVGSAISLDGEHHFSGSRQLGPLIPKTLPYDLALRIIKDGNVPQIQFNEDGVWHDFAPDKGALKAGPRYPHLVLFNGACLSDHRVHRPRPAKGAGMNKAPAAAAVAAAGAGTAADGEGDSAPPPHKKARLAEVGGCD